jgi:ubiquinone/menaquinone biosynthesis C-methylase UbiE
MQDDTMLAQPLLNALREVPEPFILDFATGTGRLSLARLNQAEFKGRIIALDLSLGMLKKAAAKLSPASTARVELLRHVSLPLPFPDAAFDAVCALEVLEMFPAMDEPLAELSRVLRPGGILLTSRSTEASRRWGRIKSARAMTGLLETHGLEQVQITKWWKLFDRVIAVKRGDSQPIGRNNLSAILKCPSCQLTHWSTGTDRWTCQTCSRELSLTKDGILLNPAELKL